MPVIARDAVASDHLVYAWPFPIGPEDYEVSCADDELVVMCPAWLVGDRLGPGRHRWRTPDPSRPSAAYFVLTAPVEVSFDMITQFMIPATGQPVRLRANGSLQVRCLDPALLVAQFVGLPFDHVNDGVLRSVSRSIERMLARLLTRRVVMAGTPHAVMDPAMLPNIIEELVAYNPAAGAVFGVELVRFGHMTIVADDGRQPWQQMLPMVAHRPNGHDTTDMLSTARGRPANMPTQPPPLQQPPAMVPPPVPAMVPPPVPAMAPPPMPVMEPPPVPSMAPPPVPAMVPPPLPSAAPVAVPTTPPPRSNAITPDSGAVVSGEVGRGSGSVTALSGVVGGVVGGSTDGVVSGAIGGGAASGGNSAARDAASTGGVVSGAIGGGPRPKDSASTGGAVSGSIGGAPKDSASTGGAVSGSIGGGPKDSASTGGAVSGAIGGAPKDSASTGGAVSGSIGGAPKDSASTGGAVSGSIGGAPKDSASAVPPPLPPLKQTPPPLPRTTQPSAAPPPPTPAPSASASGELPAAGGREKKKTSLGVAPPALPGTPPPVSSPPLPSPRSTPSSAPLPPLPSTPPPASRRAASVDVPPTGEGQEEAQPTPGASAASSSPAPSLAQGTSPPRAATNPGEARGSILGIGVAHIGSSEVATGEIAKKIAPGGRVLVPGPNGLMQSATVRQLLQGYYELEVGGSGETIWVPMSGVVPES